MVYGTSKKILRVLINYTAGLIIKGERGLKDSEKVRNKLIRNKLNLMKVMSYRETEDSSF